MRRNSIFIKLLSLFLLFTILIIGLLWFLQVQFLENYYHYQKAKQMETYGEEIAKKIHQEGFSEEVRKRIEEISIQLNGRIMILNQKGEILYQTGIIGIHRIGRVSREVWDQTRLGKTTYYKISTTAGKFEFLAVVSTIEEYVYYFITPLQPIEEAVATTQQFYLYIALIGVLIALLLSGIFSKTITDPLVKLNNVAKEMAQLNFDVRWNFKRKDEIGELGSTLNFLTSQLKDTIGRLKEELKKEKNVEKMRKQFVARVSHEFQTPISLIKGYVEALQDKVPLNEQEEEEYLRIIEEEANKLSTMAKDLLDLSQLESGNFKVEIESFEITSLLHIVLSKFELLRKKKRIEFSLFGDEHPYFVKADEYRIEQVLTNLLQNAVNHCPTGGKIEVTIRDLRERIRISIYNEGEPIQESEIPYIWESFYKGEGKKTGTGLGLAIVKNVLELHDSQYGVKNIQKGVEFYFELKKDYTVSEEK